MTPIAKRRRLLSTGAAARVAGCSAATIRRAADHGDLEAVRLGRTGDRRIYLDSLQAWLRPAQAPDEATT